VCTVDLHAIEPCLNGVSGSAPKVFDDTSYLIYPQSPRFGVDDAGLGVGGYSLVGARDRRRLIRLDFCFGYTN
jgi:hypothetical protein